MKLKTCFRILTMHIMPYLQFAMNLNCFFATSFFRLLLWFFFCWMLICFAHSECWTNGMFFVSTGWFYLYFIGGFESKVFVSNPKQFSQIQWNKNYSNGYYFSVFPYSISPLSASFFTFIPFQSSHIFSLSLSLTRDVPGKWVSPNSIYPWLNKIGIFLMNYILMWK